jgi:hypothetical protein
MFISMCGLPFQQWEPLKYVKSWLFKNRRGAEYLQGPNRNMEAADNAGLQAM